LILNNLILTLKDFDFDFNFDWEWDDHIKKDKKEDKKIKKK